MKKPFSFLSLLALAAMLWSCANQQKIPVGDTSANALDWSGSYRGVLPCADCEGIETTVRLNQDQTYVYETHYLGRSSGTTLQGKFSWNAGGNTITLDGLKHAPNQFLVGENQLILLDATGHRMQGDLAERYVLTRETAGAGAPLQGTFWKLTELMGRSVPDPAPGTRVMHLVLSPEDGRVQGFAGCNSLTGRYTLQAGNRIRFADLTTTLMACKDMSYEESFKKILETADNYSLLGDTLTLNKARMAPLARFVAGKQP